MDWRLLKEALKPSWILGIQIIKMELHPHLYPRFRLVSPFAA